MPKPPPRQTLAHPVGVLYEVRWSEVCPWLILFKALRVTLLARVILLAAIGVLLTQWGSAAIDDLLPSAGPSLTELTDDLARQDAVLPLAQRHPVSSVIASAASSPLLQGWHGASEPFSQLVNREISWQTTALLQSLGARLPGLQRST